MKENETEFFGDKIENVFSKLDTNQDGIVTYEDLKDLNKLNIQLSEQVIQHIMKYASRKQGLTLDDMRYYAMTTEYKLRRLFRKLDKNRDGYITKNELTLFMKESLLANQKMPNLNLIFAKLDQNNDQKITFDEFVKFHHKFISLSTQSLFDNFRNEGLDMGRIEPVQPIIQQSSTFTLVCARFISSLMSRTLTAPMDRIRISMQAQEQEDKIMDVAKRIYAKRGLRGFYDGNWTNIIKVIPETSIKFTVYGYMMKQLELKSIEASFMERMRCGIISGCIAHIIVYPLELVRTRKALYDKYKGIGHTIKTIINEEGYFGLYKGLIPSTLSIVPYAATNIAIFTTIRDYYIRKEKQPASMNVIIGSAFISSSIAQFLSYPFTLLRTKLQIKTNPSYARQTFELIKITRNIWQRYGYKGFYRGILPHYLKQVPSGVSSYYLYEKTRIFLEEKKF